MIHYGVDVASFQHPNNAPIEWAALYTYLYAKGNCQPFVIIKITESDNYANPFAYQDIQDALAAGFSVAVYHFVHGDVPVDAQISWIVPHLENIEFIFLDCETENGLDNSTYVELINQMAQQLAATVSGIKIGVYTFNSFLAWLDSAGYSNSFPLWFADPSNVNPEQERVITQTGQGSADGITGAVDFDQADENGYGVVFSGGVVTPTPTPTPVITPTPTPTPTPIPTPSSTPLPHITFISLNLDQNGNGSIILDGGQNSAPGVTSSSTTMLFSNFLAATSQGSDPPINNGYWMNNCHAQIRGEYLLLTVTHGIPNSQAGIYVLSF